MSSTRHISTSVALADASLENHFRYSSGIRVARSWHIASLRMRVVCALCEQEGKPSYLGDREPYDNSATTHALCPRHTGQAIEVLASSSFPDAEMLIVVRPNDTDLYEYLLQRFAGVSGVKVILERRQASSRSGGHVRNERRIRQGTASALGYIVVRFKRKPSAVAIATREAMSDETLRRLIREKIQDGRLPRGRLTSAISGGPGDESRCGVCDRIITKSESMMLLPRSEESPANTERTIPLHGDCFQMWSQADR